MHSDFFSRPAGFENCALLKESKSKILLRCPIASSHSQQFCLIKIYLYPGLLQSGKYIFRRSKGKKEIELAREISRRGIPTVMPEKFQDIKKWGILKKSIIVTAQLPDSLNLEELLINRQLPDRRLKKKIIEEYGQLARLIHDQGVYQEDFDPNNILYQKKQSGSFQLYFLDFERIRIVKKLPFAQRIHLLAKLNRMGRRLPKTDQMRFLKAYLGSQTTKEDRKRWIHEIRREEENIFLKDQRRAWKQCTKSNSRIGFIKYRSWRGYYRKKHHTQKYYTKSDLVRVIQSLEQQTGKLKDFSNFFDLTARLEDRKEILKVRFFQYSGLRYRLPQRFKQTPLIAAWKTDNGYLKNRAADFIPVAAVEKRTSPTRYEGYLIRKY